VAPTVTRAAPGDLASAVRADDWWDYKLLVILLVFPATALAMRVPLAPLWPAALVLVAALTAGAIFASVVNDITDLAEDAMAGKPNAVARMPKRIPGLILAGTAAVGVGIAWTWRGDPFLDSVYIAAWVAFLAYSLPPLRLKARGVWGVLAMGLGEAALPSLVAALLCAHAAGRPAPPLWIAAVVLWAFGHGARAIIWHQLGDSDADARASVGTLVRRRGAVFARRMGEQAAFPIEIIALAAMLVMMGSALPFVGLALYLAYIPLRMRFRKSVPTIVAPVPKHYLLMQDYYLCFLPIAVLAAAAIDRPRDGLALILFLLLFPRAPLRILYNMLLFTRRAVSGALRLGRGVEGADAKGRGDRFGS
jgi:hypothetical protein